MKLTAVRGFNDILPPGSTLWRHAEEEASRLFSTYGFSEIRLPIMEKTELFKRSIGETTDIVEKEMYTFTDRRGDSLTLRPEGTAPAVRAYIEHQLYSSPLTKLFYFGPMFRYERPQKGRYRQFYQIGAEVLGDSSPTVDAETIEMLVRFFRGLGLTDAFLEINSLGCAECRPTYKDALLKFLKSKEEELCENCQRRIGENPLRALDCKSAGCVEATSSAPHIVDHICGDCSEHFEGVKKHLELLSVDFKINHRMVRGLDYYTRTTFEITSSGGELGAQNAIAAGGRYDSLVKELGGPATPCFGFAIGMERLILLLKDEQSAGRPLIYFIAVGSTEATKKGIELTRTLRDNGASVISDLSAPKLKSAMKRADRIGASFVVIIGDEELAEERAIVKELSTGEQEKIPLKSVTEWFKGRDSLG
ncbi:MAG: histidine--tRNA ligase [Thermodesulfobacteriota bacterium]